MTDTMDNSFDENDTIDLTSVIAEFPLGDEYPNQNIPIKKLSSVFDNMISKQNSNIDETINSNGSMKVFLRVRPIKNKDSISTVTIESDNSIITNAPESSKRAQYTKTESRHYVSSIHIYKYLYYILYLVIYFCRFLHVFLVVILHKMKFMNIQLIHYYNAFFVVTIA